MVEIGADTAERLLTQTECPSWLYPVVMGATTRNRWAYACSKALDEFLAPWLFPDTGDGKDARLCPACGEGRLALRRARQAVGHGDVGVGRGGALLQHGDQTAEAAARLLV